MHNPPEKGHDQGATLMSKTKNFMQIRPLGYIIGHKCTEIQIHAEYMGKYITFDTFPAELNGVVAGSMFVHSFVHSRIHPSFTKCTIMYHTQMAGSRSAIFAHVSMLTRYIPQPSFIKIVKSLTFIFKVKDWN